MNPRKQTTFVHTTSIAWKLKNAQFCYKFVNSTRKYCDKFNEFTRSSYLETIDSDNLIVLLKLQPIDSESGNKLNYDFSMGMQ